MTDKQKKAIERIKAVLIKELAGRSTEKIEYEIKRFEIDDTYCDSLGMVWVVAEWGIVGDSGTAAAILCRESVQITIGKRGGIAYIVDKLKGGIAYRRFNWHFRDPMLHAAWDAQRCEDRHMKWYKKHKTA